MNHASDKQKLKELGITSILICASYIEPTFPEDFTYKILEVHDLPDFDIAEYFEESYNFIKDEINKGKILIHCAAGLSRSPTFVTSYLMRENKWTFEDSYRFVKKAKPSININYGFIDQLKEYEEAI